MSCSEHKHASPLHSPFFFLKKLLIYCIFSKCNLTPRNIWWFCWLKQLRSYLCDQYTQKKNGKMLELIKTNTSSCKTKYHFHQIVFKQSSFYWHNNVHKTKFCSYCLGEQTYNLLLPLSLELSTSHFTFWWLKI